VDRSSEPIDTHRFLSVALMEIAVGVVMEQLDLGADEARTYLLGRARSDNRPAPDVAGDIVNHRRA